MAVRAVSRQDLRQEPYAVVLQVRICAGAVGDHRPYRVQCPPASRVLPKHGYSKDHRPDLKQMVINLATTGQAGFPIWMEAHSGNATDKKILYEATQKMQTFCKQIEIQASQKPN